MVLIEVPNVWADNCSAVKDYVMTYYLVACQYQELGSVYLIVFCVFTKEPNI
jgi:hypothetical protein